MKAENKKTYVRPELTRVVLEDKRVIAMSACNRKGVELPPGQSIYGGVVLDAEGAPILNYDPS